MHVLVKLKLAILIILFSSMVLTPVYTDTTYPTVYTVPYGEFEQLKIHQDGSLETPVLKDLDDPTHYQFDGDKTTSLESIDNKSGKNGLIKILMLDCPIEDLSSVNQTNPFRIYLKTPSNNKSSHLFNLRVTNSIIMTKGPVGGGSKKVYGYNPDNYPGPDHPGPYPDISEGIVTTEEVEATDVVIIDPQGNRKVTRSARPYDPSVCGIIAENPMMYIAQQPDTKPLALAGRVMCKVTDEAGPIRRGDLLVTSSTPGHAMKADPDKISYGMVLGKALQPFPFPSSAQEKKKQGKILVLVNMQ